MNNLTQTALKERLLPAARVFVEESALAKPKGETISSPMRKRTRSGDSTLGDEMNYWKRFLGRLLLSAARGAVCGLGISFFMFLRLGMPKDAETAGYISGLLLLAGLEFELTVEVLRSALSLIFTDNQSQGKSGQGTRPNSGSRDSQHNSSGAMEKDCGAPFTSNNSRCAPVVGDARALRSRGSEPLLDDGTARNLLSAHDPASLKTAASGKVRLLPPAVTVVIPVLDEASRVAAAVSSLVWADEVIVVDGGSTDTTVELARGTGALVIRLPGATIAAQRNAGIAAARNPWILALDVDETVPDSLISEIASVTGNPKHQAYRVRLRNFYVGAELRYGCWGRDWHVRLFRREFRFVERRVHESLEFVADVGTLRSCLEHTPYRDLEHHCSKMLRYARLGAQDLHAQGRSANVLNITVVPFWRFVREYVLFQGWRDGARGLVCAALSATAALLKYAHLIALTRFHESPECAQTAFETTDRIPRKEGQPAISC